jgi:hypothetical protein
MTPQGPWSIRCARCGKNDAEHGEFAFEIVFDESREENIMVCLDCYRSDDLAPIANPSNPYGFRRMSRFANRFGKRS